MRGRKVNHLQLRDRPREKLQQRGVAALRNAELIQLIIGTGTKKHSVRSLAENLADIFAEKSLYGQELELGDLLKQEGIQVAKAARFVAAFELARRLSGSNNESITAPRQLVPYLKEISSSRQENLMLFTLSGARQVIDKHLISIGTLDAALAHPREIYYKAITDGAAAIVLAHNHPSGYIEPSEEDKLVTQQLARAGEILGIPLLDHLIINSKLNIFSFQQNSLISV